MNKSNDTVRVRFAPSPTGEMHLGGIRSLLFQVLFARKQGGTFILRIEDTDQERLVKGSVERLLESMQWLGIEPDEGVCLIDGKVSEKGDFGPYTQTKRKETYQKYADQLLKEGKAYRCFATKEELDEMRKEQQAKHLPPRYDGRYRDFDPQESAAKAEKGEPFVIRFKMPEKGKVTAKDVVYGDIDFDYDQFDDHVIIKSDGLPTYHFASVVDDHEMQISHVFRGEEWISSWPRHIATYEAFGWDKPIFIHLPIVLGSDKQKLSKRHGAQTILQYRDDGYLAEAIINHLAFLGWNPKTDQELFLWDELVDAFDITGINKANPVFDAEKLDYLNGKYIRDLSVEGLVARTLPWLSKADWFKSVDGKQLQLAVKSVQERARKLTEIPELIKFYFDEPKIDLELIPFKKQEKSECARVMDWAVVGLSTIPETDWNLDIIERELRSRIEEADIKVGEMLWPMRAALTGEKASPGAFEVAEVLGKEETIKRLKRAMELLNK